MCAIIYFPDGTEVQTVEDFEDIFKIEAVDYADKSYSGLIFDACMCQLNLKDFFNDHPDWKYDFNGDYWMNENYYKR